MKILILYYSESGNTKKIAESMFNALKDVHQIELFSIKKAKIENLQNYDLIFLGAPCHHSTLAKKMLKFLENLPILPDMPVVGFFTHSTTMPAGTDRNKSLYQEWAGRCLPAFETAAQNKKYLLVDVFHCQSSATLPIELFIHAKIIPDKNEWKTYKKEMRTHPNKTDFGDAQQFALKMVNLI